MKFGIVVFPGSNCDHDAYYVIKKVLKQPVDFIWHKDTDLRNSDVIILPGGFSYGDYLRSGSIARFSPIMNEVIAFSHKGGRVIGICNGFQILLEAQMLPGALISNNHLRFRCQQVFIKTTTTNTPFTSAYSNNQILRMPIAHHGGNYIASEREIGKLFDEDRVVFQYCQKDGAVTENANPNGSLRNIAGIISQHGNILGMMPHPERASESILGSRDGLGILESLMQSVDYVA